MCFPSTEEESVKYASEASQHWHAPHVERVTVRPGEAEAGVCLCAVVVVVFLDQY